MGTALRVIRSGALHPTVNMGLDEALLLEPGPPTLRLYRWQPAGLSLGYFQSSAPFARVPGDHVVVRRLTGGGAIYHGDELTFALTLDADLLPGPVPASYDLIHGAVRSALRDAGVDATHPEAAPEAVPRPAQPWCFAEPVAADLLSRSGRKLVGSAQRRIHRPVARVLHHGSIPARAPAPTPFCGSLAEYGDPASIGPRLEAALADRVAAALGLRATEGEPTTVELERATALAARYADEAFTHRR